MASGRLRRSPLPLLLCLVAFGVAACSGDEIQAPADPIEGTLTVDASQGWGYASLASQQAVVIADPAASADWDIGFNATSVMLNGGVAGPGGVSAYCLCQNAGATDAELLAMTAESEVGDFDGVTAAQIPASGFESERYVPAVDGWHTGSGASAIAATDKVWLLRLAGETSFAKFHVLSLEAPTATHPGRVTVEFAVQPAADAPFGPAQTVTVDAASPVSLDLDAGAITTDPALADLRFDGWTLKLNGGAGGTGKAAAAASTEAFAAITTASIDSRAYKADAFAGVFNSHPWYKYNLTGDHRITPTFDVYLLKRGDDVYKVQLVGYYGPAGETRRISFRYARLTN